MAQLAENLSSIYDTMQDMGHAAHQASEKLANASTEVKDEALKAMARFLRQDTTHILDANAEDIKAMRNNGETEAFIDRSTLTQERIEAIADSLISIAELDDPVGKTITAWDRPNGIGIERVRTPLGVIGVIFEARPNVTADAGALCLKSGNAVILRGGSSCFKSNIAIHQSLTKGLETAGLPLTSIQIVPTSDREAVGHMLAGLDGMIDVIVPRGGKSLVERVQRDARVPVFAHLEGICHIYVQKSIDVKKACDVIVNAKMRRTGICGATETVLIDEAAIDTHLSPILDALSEAGCEIRGDRNVCNMWSQAIPADESDWSSEYLAPVISVKIVPDIDAAVQHISHYGSGHTDAILTENDDQAAKFLNEVNSAIVMHNVSTQFADGGEFGMGAEIGIATGKMHARGPIGLEQLTSFKYKVRGNGQTRP